MKQRNLLIIIMTAGAGLLFGCVIVNKAVNDEFPDRPLTPIVLAGKSSSEAPIQPIVPDDTLNPAEVALGQELFQDKHLSKNNTISCASCHDLAAGGGDGLRVSLGIDQRQGMRNAPTVFNCSLNYKQFWDGRAASLADQIDGPLQSPDEMHSSWAEVTAKLQQDEHYIKEFRAVYSDGLKSANIKKALVVFEHSLTTPDSRLDHYLRGSKDALTVRERAGYRLFISSGCIACHQGTNVGGSMMQHFGVMNDPYSIQQNDRLTDHGVLLLSDAPDNSPLFKVPSLRNVARTAPYFHDGSALLLSDAVKIMGYSQLGRHFSNAETALLLEFLKSLTGKYQGKSL